MAESTVYDFDWYCRQPHTPLGPRTRALMAQAREQAAYQTDPKWAAKLIADAEQLDEIRRLGT